MSNEDNGADALISPMLRQIRTMVDLVERMWLEKRRFPTTKEFRDVLGGDRITNERVRELVDHRDFEWLLSQRGLPNGTDADLMPEQVAAIQVFLNTMDMRVWSQKLADIGVKPVQFTNWRKNKKFEEALQAEAQKTFSENLPMAHQALLREVGKGNVRAIKVYYDKLGFGHDVAAASVQDVRFVMLHMIEIIQKHVTDETILKAIAREFEGLVVSMNQTSEQKMTSNVKGQLL